MYFVDLHVFCKGAGKGIDCIRALSTEALQQANKDVIVPLLLPNIPQGPVVDGNLVLDVPNYLVAQGRFHSNISILIADDIDEVRTRHIVWYYFL